MFENSCVKTLVRGAIPHSGLFLGFLKHNGCHDDKINRS